MRDLVLVSLQSSHQLTCTEQEEEAKQMKSRQFHQSCGELISEGISEKKNKGGEIIHIEAWKGENMKSTE